LPVVGPILFQHDPLTYLAFALVPVVWFVLYRTRWGLELRAVGAAPASMLPLPGSRLFLGAPSSGLFIEACIYIEALYNDPVGAASGRRRTPQASAPIIRCLIDVSMKGPGYLFGGK
jgi:hypothetical protein